MKHHPITLPMLVISLVIGVSAFAADDKKGPRIKKCQDAAGKWHYGDQADEQCAQSKVIELDRQGVKRKEIAAPLTEAELKAHAEKQAEEEKAKKLAAEQKRQDEIMLATYAVEADITLTRDRKLADVDTQIHASEQTLKSLQNSLKRLRTQAAEEQRGGKPVSAQTTKTIANNEAQIAKHESLIKKMQNDKEAIRVQYDAEVIRFRELKSKQVAAPAAASGTAPAKR
jgi:predicted phage tail protein